jgi:hypothetical protein
MKRKQSHNFVLVLDGASSVGDGLEDALYSAGCDDAILAFRNGVAYLEFDRDHRSFQEAILAAVKNVESAKRGVTVAHVEPDDLVNASEVARRLACTREYVRLLVAGQRGRGGFPVPLAGVTGTTLFWSWAAVVRWLLEQGRLTDTAQLERAETIRDINHALATRLDREARARRLDLCRRLGLERPN